MKKNLQSLRKIYRRNKQYKTLSVYNIEDSYMTKTEINFSI